MDNKDNVNEFIDNANGVAKLIGHNRFQKEIESLNDELSQLRMADTEKEMKFELFKKTIATLQQQLQDKSDELYSLQTSLSDFNKNNDKNSKEKEHQYEEKCKELYTLQSQHALMTAEKTKMAAEVETLQNIQKELNSSLQNLKHEKDTLDQLVSELKGKGENVLQNIASLEEQCSMMKNINQTLQEENDNLKLELSTCKTCIEERDIRIKSIDLQLKETELVLQEQTTLEQIKSDTVIHQQSATSPVIFRTQKTRERRRR